MTHRLATFVLFVLCTIASALGQERSLRAGDWSGQGWEGDVGFFRESNGLLSYRNDDQAGVATISKPYQKSPSGLLYWEMQTRFDALPTTANTFVWTLFFQKHLGTLYAYSLEPAIRGSGLLLTRYTTDAGRRTFTDRTILATLPLDDRLTTWGALTIQALYTAHDGLRVSAIQPNGTTFTADPITTIADEEIMTIMALRTHFSAKKKLKYSWILPRVETTLGKETPELTYTDLKIYDEGRICLRLDRVVRVDQAVATVSGTAASITLGQSSDEIILTLPFAFAQGMRYAVRVENLLDLHGTPHTITLDFEAESDDPQEQNRPQAPGIFITEIMADPPTTGPLAGTAYIELYNATPETISLGALRLQYKQRTYRLPAVALAPYSYALLYPMGSAIFAQGVQVPMPDFPALAGARFDLSLEALSDGRILDYVHFSSALYGVGLPVGGASVERVSMRPAEWRRSDAPQGGTPGSPSTMRAHKLIQKQSVIINELMLSPKPTGEKYIEFYNNSDTELNLSDLYLTYRNTPTAAPKSWLLVTQPTPLAPGAYVVLCPYPDALPRIHEQTDPKTYIERIDFPSLSPTYTELTLVSHRGGVVVDEAIYRRQWLGATSGERSHHSLERLAPDTDGRQQKSWSRSAQGGTPGVRNHPLDTDDSTAADWPESQALTPGRLLYYATKYSDLLTIDLYHTTGIPILTVRQKQATELLHHLMANTAPLPTLLYIIRVTIAPPREGLAPIAYTDKWMHVSGI